MGSFAQTDSSFITLNRQLKVLNAQRIRDSLKLDVLNQEIQHLVLRGNSNATENYEKLKAKEDSIKLKSQIEEINRIKASTQGVPVMNGVDTLFLIYADLGPYNAIERAKTANNKINNLINRALFNQDSLKVSFKRNIATITYEDEIVLAINDIDALWADKDIKSLANDQLNTIKNSVIDYREQNGLSFKIKRFGELIIISILFIAFIVFLNKLFRKLKFWLLNKTQWFKKGLEIKNYEIIKRPLLNGLLDKLLLLIKILILVITFFSILPIALEIFPQTAQYANGFKTTVYEPINSLMDAIINYIPNLIKILLIVISAYFILKLLKYFANEIENENLKINQFYSEWAKPTYQIIRFLLIVFSLIVIFPYLPGSGTIAFQGISVFLGVLISIGSSSAVANAIAGIVITYMRPFQNNDWIKTGDITGIVIDKNTLVTRLKTINNEDVTIPNSAILSGATINFSSLGRTDGLVITAKIRIAYEIDEQIVTKNLLKAALNTNGISRSRTPYVFQLSLNEINATYEINAITFEPENMYYIKSDLIKNIHKQFKASNIALLSAQFISIEQTKRES